jgi:hypothetical protein
MNPGPSEEAGKAVVSFFSIMAGQPLSLALVIMNFALIGYLYYEGANAAQARKDETALLYQNRREVALLLTGCHWPEGMPLPKSLDVGP